MSIVVFYTAKSNYMEGYVRSDYYKDMENLINVRKLLLKRYE
jgi:hypothetical protein